MPELDAQDQWLELADTTVLHDTWQTDSPTWDWYSETTGKKLTQTIRTGRRPWIGSSQQAGLRKIYREALSVNQEKAL